MQNLIAQHNATSVDDTNSIGRQIFELLTWPACVYLVGDLGAGKTTLCQAIIAAAGYSGAVTSPTYNLIQEYPVSLPNKTEKHTTSRAANRVESRRNDQFVELAATIYHMDLYRLEDPQELYFLGIGELWSSGSLFLIEWPEKGKGILQEADYIVEISKNSAETEDNRNIMIYQTF